jgi:hypothetical protein
VRGESGQQIRQLLGLAGPQYGNQALSQWHPARITAIRRSSASMVSIDLTTD